MKAKIFNICCAIGLIVFLLYMIPYTETIDVSLDGMQCRIGEDICEEQKTVIISGKFKRYLFKADHFKGIIQVSGYDFKHIDNLVEFYVDDGYGYINYIGFTDGYPEIEFLGTLLFAPHFKEVLVLISEPVYDSDSKSWSAEDGLYVSAPATNKADALEIAAKLSQNSQWLSIAQWK
ncbi:MAG: hypothetical protein ACRCST_03190 [Turicibacter sp.]